MQKVKLTCFPPLVVHEISAGSRHICGTSCRSLPQGHCTLDVGTKETVDLVLSIFMLLSLVTVE